MNRRGQGRGDRGRVSGFALPVPKQIPGLVAWYRADMGITIGTGVSGWADQSGTGDANKNLAQATGAKQPTFNAADGAYGGKPTLSFASASVQSLKSGVWASSSPQPSTTFVIGNFSGAVTNEYMVDGGGLNEQVVMNNSGTNKAALYAGTVLGVGTVTSAPQVIVGVFNGGASQLYVSALTVAITGGVGASNRAGITIGLAGDGVSAPLNGKIAEAGVYNGALSASQVAQILQYAGARYGISIGA